MSKQPIRLAYISSFIDYLLYLLAPFHRGLGIDLEGSSIFLTLMLSMHIDRLSLFSYLYGTLLICITLCLGGWAGATAFCIEVGWYSTVAVSAWYSVHQLPGCECIGKRSCTPL